MRGILGNFESDKGNLTSIKIPKKYEKQLLLVEKDSDGYWAYTIDGYHFAGMGGDCHTAHEDSQKDLLGMIRTIEPCQCKECEAVLKKAMDKSS